MKFLLSLLLILQTAVPSYGAATRTVVADQIKNSLQTQTYLFPAAGDTLVGRASTDTLTNKTLTSPIISSISNTGVLTLPTLTTTLVGRNTTDTLTNKTLTSPVLTTPTVDIYTFTDQGVAPSAPSAGSRKLYSKTTGKFYQLDSSGVERELGSGGTGVNFVTGGDAEGGSIWATYADAAGTAPVDGTGGIPSITDATTSATTPLSGANSFLLPHPASNTQGNGWSYDFTIDNANKAKVLNIEFDYLISSGAFVPGSSGVDSDIVVWIYDVTNAQLIQPSSYKLLSNNSSVADHFSATFQTNSNSTSYRLILHNGKTTATAFTIKLDSLSIAPSKYIYGSPITDWQAYTPTITGTTLTSSSFKYRRVGDSIQIQGVFVSNTANGSNLTLTLPSGLTIDATKADSSLGYTYGDAVRNNSSATTRKRFKLLANSGAGNLIYFTNDDYNAAASPFAGILGTAAIAGGDTVSLQINNLPILGWSSSIQMSDSTDTRVVAAIISGTSTVATSSRVVIIPTAKTYDTHGAMNISTGVYTVPVSGFYKVDGYVRTASTSQSLNNTITLDLMRNGSTVGTLGATYVQAAASLVLSVNGSATEFYNAGDTLSLASASTVNTTLNVFQASISRVSGPSAIAATESINVSYTGTAGGSIGTSETLQTFGTKEEDSHGAWNGTVFTAPISGMYSINAAILTQGITLTTSQAVTIVLYKNGAGLRTIGFSRGNGATTISYFVTGQDLIRLKAGETLSIYAASSVATAQTSSGGYNKIQIVRVGN